jgi:ATP-binding cassette subfamily B protein/subfamily B ATP-binding cassette protein MsbA
VGLSLVAGAAASGLRLATPAVLGFAVDRVLARRPPPAVLAAILPDSPMAAVTAIAGGLLVIAGMAVAANTLGRYLVMRAQRRLQSRMLRRVCGHALQLPLHRVYSYTAGGLASLLRDDITAASGLLSTVVYESSRSAMQLVSAASVLAAADWRFLAAGLVVGPPLALAHRAWLRRIRPLWRDIRGLRQRIDSHTTQVFGGIRTVRSFGRQRTEAARLARANHLLQRQVLFVWWRGTAVEVLWGLCIPVGAAGLLVYGAHRILADAQRVAAGLLDPGQAFTAGGLVASVAYLALVLQPLAGFARSATATQAGLAAFDRLLDVLEDPVMAEDGASRWLRPEEVAGRVTLRNVTFRYPGSRLPALEDVTLDIPPGSVTALVGRSGVGKTTLCNLVARLDTPTTGTVEVDGIDVRTIATASYRRLVAVVEQEVFLFDGTVAENIAYGAPGASMAAIRRAAEAAHAAGFIESLERGYDTWIGERGARLSGGQRKRLAIARALLVDPRILILDEATSELDAESERLVHEGLASLLRGRTVFVIAHRLSTVLRADLVVVLDRGRLVALGTHAEVLAGSDVYRRLVDAQLVDLSRIGGVRG